MPAPVLIVGAGPTGLTTASELKRRGIAFRLIEQLDMAAPNSRAMVVHARTLETFERMGVVDRFLNAGKVAGGVALFTEGVQTAHVALKRLSGETAYPFVLMISQDQTEKHLTAHLEGLGGRIERGLELKALKETASGIEATLTGAGGKEETGTYSYVVGCDGSHSAVRHLTGIPFKGAAYAQAFYLADCLVNGPLASDVLSFFMSRHGFVVFFPFVHKQSYRLIIVNEEEFRPKAETPTLDELQDFVGKVSGGRLKLSKPEWIARFRLHHRAVPTFRKSRAFLAGDAAHIHSPAGGQGMNTGIQDAFNLAWKLAHVLEGRLPEAALSSYDEERHPVAVDLLQSTDRMFQLLAHDSRAIRLLLRVGAPLLLNTVGKLAAAQRQTMRFVTQLAIHYSNPKLFAAIGKGRATRSRLVAGARLPDSPMQLADTGDPVRLHQAIAKEEYSLLLFCLSYAPQSLMPTAEVWREKIAKATGTPVKIRLVVGKGQHGVEESGCLIDSGKAFTKLCGLKAPALVLVRPDGYVGWATALD